MSTPPTRFPFIDAVHAAEVLRVTPDAVLDLISAGRLKPYGGKASNPFLRSADVVALAEELGVSPEEHSRRTKSSSARVQARLTADSRWSDVSESDVRDWAARVDSTRKQAARTAASVAIQRLQTLLRVLEEQG